MFTFKPINSSDVSLIETKVHKEQTVHSGSTGLISVQYRSGSKREGAESHNEAGSYWSSLHLLFYQSGSELREKSGEKKKYNQPAASLASNERTTNPQNINKFNISGSVISIPQKLFGERIKPKSVTLTDNSTATEITLKDDGYGNLYAVGNSISKSAASSPSASANYVGNVFYNSGIITVTATGSYATSIKYTEVGRTDFQIKFKSEQTIYTHEYTVRIDPSDFTYTMNTTARTFLQSVDGEILPHGEVEHHRTINNSVRGDQTGSDLSKGINLRSELTGSGWSPYFNQIQLYSDTENVMNVQQPGPPRGERKLYEPVIVANLPRAVQIRDDMSLTFKIRLDI